MGNLRLQPVYLITHLNGDRATSCLDFLVLHVAMQHAERVISCMNWRSSMSSGKGKRVSWEGDWGVCLVRD